MVYSKQDNNLGIEHKRLHEIVRQEFEFKMHAAETSH